MRPSARRGWRISNVLKKGILIATDCISEGINLQHHGQPDDPLRASLESESSGAEKRKDRPLRSEGESSSYQDTGDERHPRRYHSQGPGS